MSRIRAIFRHRPIVLYDGACTLCRKSKRVVELLDPTAGFEWIPMQDPRAASFGVPREVLTETMVVLHKGRRYDGFLGWKRILLRHPFFWVIVVLSAAFSPWLLAVWGLFLTPFLEPVGDAVYRWVATNRHRMPGSTCDVAGGEKSK